VIRRLVRVGARDVNRPVVAATTGAGLLAILAATLWPFAFEAHSLTWRQYVESFGLAPASLLDFPRNLILFMPLGGGIVALMNNRGRSGWHAIALAGLIGAGLSLGVESLQIFLPARESNISDVVGNALGAMGGGSAWRWWRERSVTAGLSPQVLSRLSAGAFGLYLALMLLFAGTLMWGVRPRGWNEASRLLPGNTFPHSRPWRGEVADLLVLDRAVDASGAAPLLAGVIPADVRSAPAPGVNRSREFTVAMTVTTFDVYQPDAGPIAASSSDPSQGNLALFQDEGRLVLRWRSPLTAANDMEPQLEFPGVFTSLAPTRIVVTFDGYLARVHTPETTVAILVGPESVFSAMLRETSCWPTRPGRLEWWTSAAPLTGIMFVPLGMLLGPAVGAARRQALRRTLIVAGVTAPALIIEAFVTAYGHGSLRWNILALGMVTTVAGFAATARVVHGGEHEVR
jgi:hypothetical protein